MLLRSAVRDHPAQARSAEAILTQASFIAVSLTAICEFVWVLRSVYKYPSSDIASALRTLLSAATLSVDRTAVEAGLAVLAGGGDFADGVIAYEGRRQGAQTFVSFDRKAVGALEGQGFVTWLLQ